MLAYYLKIAVRNLLRQRLFTVLNLMGMAIGVASCLLIAVYVAYERSFDAFHPNVDRMWRMGFEGRLGDQEMVTSNLSPEAAADLQRDYSEVAAVTRIEGNGNTLLRQPDLDRAVKDPDVMFADPNFFGFFGFRLLQGAPDQVLAQPNQIVLTASLARKLFGDKPALGMTLRFDNRRDVVVSGIAADPPPNSHLHFTALASFTHLDQERLAANARGERQPSWLSNMNTHTYVRLQPGVDAEAFFTRVRQQVLTKYVGPAVQNFLGMTLQQFEQTGQRIGFFAEPVPELHLAARTQRSLGAGGSGPGDSRYVQFLVLVGVFILLIACVNFINLSTARATERAKEVGVRKVLGSGRGELVSQFLTESLVLSTGAVLVGLLLAETALPFLSRLTGATVTAGWLHSWWLPLLLAGLALVLGVVAGGYPAAVLANFGPFRMLSGSKGNAGGRERAWLRSGLVVLQFSLSILLVIVTLVVSDQLGYLRNRSLGFDKAQLVMLEDVWVIDNPQRAVTLRNELAALPGVESASLTNLELGGSAEGDNEGMVPNNNTNVTRVITQLRTDGHLGRTLGIRMRAGRDLDPQNVADSQSVVLNETAARQFGWTPEQAVGQTVNELGEADRPFRVVGVAADFHYHDAHLVMRPSAIFIRNERHRMVLRLRTENLATTLASIESVWNRHSNGNPLDYTFASERFAALYRAEERLTRVFAVFAGLAIVIACLGLFGLAAFMAQRRQKEIGVRKVLGASVSNILWLFASRFALLVGIAFVPAALAAWQLLGHWLAQFPYRAGMQPSAFVLAGLLALVIALLTILYQALRAATANPVHALKSE